MTSKRWAAVAGLLLAAVPAAAAPWAEVGDAQLRSDFTLLTNAGLIDGLTTHWPIPWRGVAERLDDSALAGQPGYIQEAGRRVRTRAERDAAPGLHLGATVDLTNRPALIRGFDAGGIGEAQAQAVADYTHANTSIHAAAGVITGQSLYHGTEFMPDGSYINQRLGGVNLYAGYLTHWWGPGWVSALSYSNNARPFPQIGIATAGVQRFKTPLLSWIGPWRAEFVVGLLNDSRVATNTGFDGLRFTFMPVKGLEIGIARTETLCGRGHVCTPIKSYFDFKNDAQRSSVTSGQGVFDFKYSNRIGGHPFEIYTQLMNEDSNPIVHSFTSHLVGGSIWVPAGRNVARLTAEYTSSIATQDIFSFGTVGYGVSYNNSMYPVDGSRYRGRAFGYSLDSDSRLLTLQGNLIDARDRSWTLSLHHALISRPATGTNNPITTEPVTINYAEAQVVIPTPRLRFNLAARVQDDQPRPGHGWAASIEAGVAIRLD